MLFWRWFSHLPLLQFQLSLLEVNLKTSKPYLKFLIYFQFEPHSWLIHSTYYLLIKSYLLSFFIIGLRQGFLRQAWLHAHTPAYNSSQHWLVRPQSLFPLRRVLLFLVCDTVVPHPLGHLSPLLWMDVLHCVLVKTLASRAQHIEPEVSYTKVCTGTGKQCPLFHSLSQEHSRSSWDHWVICLAASSLLRAGHPFPWSLPVPYSMTFKGACQPLSSPLNQSDESRKGKYANWAHQGLEVFQEGTGGPSPDGESELEEWGWNCLQPWLLEPHSGGEKLAKQDLQSQE